MNFFALIWVFFIISALLPVFRQRRLERCRTGMLSQMQKQRGSRVIVMIHRQEMFSFLGIPLSRSINIEDSEEILRAIRLTPDNVPIDLVLHTPGGLVLAAAQISKALLEHPAQVTVMIPHYAMSGGTLIALAADRIVVDSNAVLGPVDPQLGRYPAVSILSAVEKKGRQQAEDETLILADIAEKAVKQVKDFVRELLQRHMEPEAARKVARVLTEGRWTHDYPLTCGKLKELGLTISNVMPREIYSLMDYYPQARQQRPSVQFVPFAPREREQE